MDPMGYDFDELRMDGYFFRPTDGFGPSELPEHDDGDERQGGSRGPTNGDAQTGDRDDKPRTRSRTFSLLVVRPPTPPKKDNEVEADTALHSYPVQASSGSSPATTSGLNVPPASINDILPSSTLQGQQSGVRPFPTIPIQQSYVEVSEPIRKRKIKPLLAVEKRGSIKALMLVEKHADWVQDIRRSVASFDSKQSSPITPNSARSDRSSVTTVSTPRTPAHSPFELPTGQEAEQMMRAGNSALASRRSSLSAKLGQSQETLTQAADWRGPQAAFQPISWDENERSMQQVEMYLPTLVEATREFDVTPLSLERERMSLSDFRFPAAFTASDEPQHDPEAGDLMPGTASVLNYPAIPAASMHHRRGRSVSTNGALA